MATWIEERRIVLGHEITFFVCPNCGYSPPRKYRFCPECGENLKGTWNGATEYISKETFVKCLEDWSCGLSYIEIETTGAINEIREIPAADVVKVVRCKDCINWNGNNCITMYGLASPKPNDFCARGEELEVPDND